METDALIKTLAQDAGSRAWPLGRTWGVALPLAALVAAAVFFAMLGPRPGIAAALQTLRFPFKFVVTLALAAGAGAAVVYLSRPDADPRRVRVWLLAAPLLLLASVALELLAVPRGEWEARLVGRNSLLCLTFIPLIGLGPLALFLAALRHGAPARPALAGAMAGLFAGGLAATFYAAHCPDDSPLFVATWYTAAVAVLALAGALVGGRAARW